MIKYCEADHEKLVDVAPQPSAHPKMPQIRRAETVPSPSSQSTVTFANTIPPSTISAALSDYTRQPHIHIAAIDNSLSFPHEHPRGWRSYTYGWLYLPVSVIGRPFSEKTRAHFLPLLTSKAWWEETTFQLRKLFAVDPDFHPKMFQVSSESTLEEIVIHYSISEAIGCHQRSSLQHHRVLKTCGEQEMARRLNRSTKHCTLLG